MAALRSIIESVQSHKRTVKRATRANEWCKSLLEKGEAALKTEKEKVELTRIIWNIDIYRAALEKTIPDISELEELNEKLSDAKYQHTQLLGLVSLVKTAKSDLATAKKILCENEEKLEELKKITKEVCSKCGQEIK